MSYLSTEQKKLLVKKTRIAKLQPYNPNDEENDADLSPIHTSPEFNINPNIKTGQDKINGSTK